MNHFRRNLVVLLTVLSGLTATCGAASPALAARAVNVAYGAFSWPFAFVGLFRTGQSLAAGADSTAVLTSPQANSEQLRNDAGYLDASDPTWRTTPLLAPERADTFMTNAPSLPYPYNLASEPADIALASALVKMTADAGVTPPTFSASNVAQTGQPYSVVGPGGTGNAYASNLLEAKVYERLHGSAFGVVAIALTHGESDDPNNTSYAADLTTWITSYNTDIKAITGQTRDIVFLLSQQNTYAPAGQGVSGPVTANLQYYWCWSNPRYCVMSGPKYGYAYYTGDWTHLLSYDPLGEKEAEAIFTWVLTGAWSPLWAIYSGITVSGNTVTIPLHVPVGPIQLEASYPDPHPSGSLYGIGGDAGMASPAWTNCHGFEFWTSAVKTSTPIPCTGFAITSNPSGTNVTATITVTAASSFARVAYAIDSDHDQDVGVQTATGGYTQSQTGCRCGGIKDSDPFVGPITGVAQVNRLVAFEYPQP